MNVVINYRSIVSKKSPINQVLFVDDSFNISKSKKFFLSKEFSFVSDLLKSKDLKKKFITLDLSSKKKIILVSIKKDIKSSELENLGGKFFNIFKESKINEFIINSETLSLNLKNAVGFFLHGIKLKSYSFDKYKTKKNKKNITIFVTGKNVPSFNDQLKFKSLENGTFYTRDLVSEPGNVLHPDEYAKRLSL